MEKRKQKELKNYKVKRKEDEGKVYIKQATEKNKFIGYGLLDALFKVNKQADYFALPGQVNQQIMRVVFQNWKSFFTSLKDYKVNPQKYTGRPKLPKYALKAGEKNALSRIKYA